MALRRDEASRARSPDEPVSRRAREQTPADDVLALQRSAGNQAVSAMLARTPNEKDKEAAATGPTVKGKSIGTVPLASVSLDTARLLGTGTKNHELPKELALSSRLGKHSPDLARANVEGTPLGDVEIRIPHGKTTVVLTVHNAMIGSYQASGESESWQLVGDSLTFKLEGEGESKPAEPDKTQGSWDTTERSRA
jgi:hypothetical protein